MKLPIDIKTKQTIPREEMMIALSLFGMAKDGCRSNTGRCVGKSLRNLSHKQRNATIPPTKAGNIMRRAYGINLQLRASQTMTFVGLPMISMMENKFETKNSVNKYGLGSIFAQSEI